MVALNVIQYRTKKGRPPTHGAFLVLDSMRVVSFPVPSSAKSGTVMFRVLY